MAKKKLTNEQVVEALRQSHGLKTGAAEILGVSFPTIERYIVKSAEAQAVIDHWRHRRIDRAEYKLDEAIERGEAWAVALILKDSKRGKERGYGNSLDVTSGGERLKVIVEYIGEEDTTPETTSGAEGSEAGGEA